MVTKDYNELNLEEVKDYDVNDRTWDTYNVMAKIVITLPDSTFTWIR